VKQSVAVSKARSAIEPSPKTIRVNGGRYPVTKIFLILLSVFVLRGVVHAADKIRIAVSDPNAAYMTFPLAQKKVF
jgi:hypothetical protein